MEATIHCRCVPLPISRELATSTGYVIDSLMQNDIVFVASNVFLLVIAAVGQFLFIRNRRVERRDVRHVVPSE